YLQLNLTAYSLSAAEYQFSGALQGENWEFICWEENITTISSYDNEITIQFPGTIINALDIDPVKVYIEMRRTSDWKIIDSYDYDLSGFYNAADYGSSISFDTNSVTSMVWDGDDDGLNDTLNVTIDIEFDSGIYELTAGLRDTTTDTFITKKFIEPIAYDGLESITFSFDGLKIYTKELDGPYKVSFISVAKQHVGEIARITNVHTTTAYPYTCFEHPLGTEEDASLTGDYSSYAINLSGNSDYEYLVLNVTINVINPGLYDIYADLYSSDGETWVAGDANNSISLASGLQTIQLYFEGDDIYESQTDGPYLVGYVLIGADIDGHWIPLDEDSNVHTTTSYQYTDFTSESQTPLIPSNITDIAVSNDPFSPNNDGAYDTTLITVTGEAGQILHLNIYDNNNTIIRTGMSLSASDTTYTAIWQGKNDASQTVIDGVYRIKVTDTQSGGPQDEATKTSTVVIDTAPPTGCSLVIENGDLYTNTTSVDLTSITALDDSSMKMRFKNAGGNWTSWENFQSSKSWTLCSTDGLKTVYYEAKDVAGNTITTPITETITLDTTKPSNVNISITGKGDSSSTHTNDVSATLAIQAEDATSNIEYMMIANDMAFTHRSWESYDTSKEWTLNSGDGTKTVYIKVKDSVGKVSNIYSDSIILDTNAPTGLSISINSGQTYTNSTAVILTLAATGAAKMRFSTDGVTWSNYESFATERDSWVLANGSGTKTVYFRAKDTAGNIATNVTDTIILDTTAPTISSVTSSGTTQTTATITWTTNEAATTQVEYGTTTSYGSATTINTTKITSHSQTITSLTPGTTYHYRVK
ncbi:MAG: fibronectin type III domain-containing protein, partial [Candidatus Thermoplasmatota archaeon]|nr:fibronectin type III domain-containing protein [Candidatus Thermoplasmatota archaeon]